MKLKIFSFITALSIGFSSLIFPFFSVNVLADTVNQAVIPWVPIFKYIAESFGAWAINKGADYTVDQLIGSGRKMTSDEYNSTSNDWDSCVSYMKSHGCTDSDIENLQAQIKGGDLDLSSPAGQAMEDFFAQKGANISGSFNNFLDNNTTSTEKLYCPNVWDNDSLNKFLIGQCYSVFGTRAGSYRTGNSASSFLGNPVALAIVDHFESFPQNTTYPVITFIYNESGSFKILTSATVEGLFPIEDDGSLPCTWRGLGNNYTIDSNSIIYCSEDSEDNLSDFFSKYGVNKKHIYNHYPISNKVVNSINLPSKISCYGGNIPHYYDNTIDNDDSSKNTYNNTPASIDWSKIFDLDDDKNPTFKKIDGYTPPEPTIKEDGSNYDEVINQLKESNSKLAKILGWLEDFDYDNSGKIKDHRLSPIEPDTPIFNFKLSEKFPFSLPWDMLAILSILKADPEPPKFEIPVLMPDESGKVKPIKLSDSRTGVIQGDKIVLDFSNQDLQDAAKILRWGELILFICGLCIVFWKYGK